MDLHLWFAYFAAAWLIALSPGSGAVLSMSHGLNYGVSGTTPTIVGLQLGLGVILLVAGAGVGAVLIASTTAFTVVKVLGATYLIWLGWRQWRAPVADEATKTADPTQVGVQGNAAQRSDLSIGQRMLSGFLTNVTNPKGIVFMVAVLPQFINPERPLALQLAVLLVTMLAVDTTVMHTYAWLASRLQHWLRSARAKRNQNRVFGSVLMLMGASLALVKRAT